MSLNQFRHPEFRPGQTVISIAHHPPEISPGTMAVIVRPWCGTLCAVQAPNGEIHQWFAWFELAPMNPAPGFSGALAPGTYATILSNIGHGNPPHLAVGTVVKIVKCLPHTIFYDVMVHGTEYHRWLAEFELASGKVVLTRQGDLRYS